MTPRGGINLGASRRQGRAGISLLVLGVALWIEAPLIAQASSGLRPAIADEIEKRFSPSFLVTTNGDGVYTLHQRIEDGAGLAPSDNVVCLMQECYLELARAEAARLERFDQGQSSPGELRSRLRAVRDAYTLMRRAAPGDRAERQGTWRQAITALSLCLAGEAC